MSDTVIITGKIEVSPEDAELLERDALLYGNCFVEIFSTGPARRLDPATILSGEVRLLDGALEIPLGDV